MKFVALPLAPGGLKKIIIWSSLAVLLIALQTVVRGLVRGIAFPPNGKGELLSDGMAPMDVRTRSND